MFLFRYKRKYKKKILSSLSFLLSLSLLSSLPVHAVDYKEEAEARKSLPVQTNEIENWPAGPAIGAEAALLMDVNSGAVLYSKNADERLYPASITKLLTTYIAMKECDMDEMVTFSPEAVHSINWREDANMGIGIGSSITMEETLYGVLVGSANEAAYAVAEHISGNIEDFAVLMNKTAKELGCTNSNFVTPNGIHDDNHYTTAHDMALIAKAFFSNELLCKMSGTTYYQVPTTETQPREDMIVSAKSKLLPGKEYAYEPLVGTKTGYTTQARQTLVSCAQKNGMKLVCVILKEESPYQFKDTIELFNYGFNNFNAVNISETDTKYNIDNSFFTTDTDFFGNSEPIISLDKKGYIVLPNTISFSDVSSEIVYESTKENEVASIAYTYKNIPLGNISLQLAAETVASFDFGNEAPTEEIPAAPKEHSLFFNIIKIILLFALLIVITVSVFTVRAVMKNRYRARHRRNRLKRKQMRGYLDDF